MELQQPDLGVVMQMEPHLLFPLKFLHLTWYLPLVEVPTDTLISAILVSQEPVTNHSPTHLKTCMICMMKCECTPDNHLRYFQGLLQTIFSMDEPCDFFSQASLQGIGNILSRSSTLLQRSNLIHGQECEHLDESNHISIGCCKQVLVKLVWRNLRRG